jgi:group I intron endonuclease
MIYYLYKITNLLNGKQYIGITNKPKKRWRSHKSTNKKYPISLAIQKYSQENFEFKILVIGTEEYIKELEIKAIAAFNTKAPNGYNLTDGGEGTTGWKSTPESREKCRTAQIKRFSDPAELEKVSRSHLGRKHTEETCEKHRQLMLARYENPKEREKTRQQSLGRKHSDAAKLKSCLANPRGAANRCAKRVLVHGIEYGCIKEAAIALNINYTTLHERFRSGKHPERYRYL